MNFTQFLSSILLGLFLSSGVIAAPLVEEHPVLTAEQLVTKKQKARELLSMKEINFNGQHSRTVIRLKQGVYSNYAAWDPCYRGELKIDPPKINEYGNIEVTVHRREDVRGCMGIKLVIDPVVMSMSYYDYDYTSNTYLGPFSRVITSVK